MPCLGATVLACGSIEFPLYKLLMFRAAYLDLPFSPLVALTEVVDVDMLDKQSQHEALL